MESPGPAGGRAGVASDRQTRQRYSAGNPGQGRVALLGRHKMRHEGVEDLHIHAHPRANSPRMDPGCRIESAEADGMSYDRKACAGEMQGRRTGSGSGSGSEIANGGGRG